MMPLLRKAGAFVLRDFRIESGYKTAFLIRIVDSMMLLVLFYFLSQLITPSSSPMLKGHGYGYFSFALIGLAFARYFDLTLRMFSESIRLSQVTGCFEAMMSSQTGCVTVALMSSLYGLISGGVQLLLILAAGVVVFRMDLTHLNFLSTCAGSRPVSHGLCRLRCSFGGGCGLAQEGGSNYVDPRRFRYDRWGSLFPDRHDAPLDAEDRYGQSHYLLSRRPPHDHAPGIFYCHDRKASRYAAGDCGDFSADQSRIVFRGSPKRPKRRNTDAVLAARNFRGGYLWTLLATSY